MLESHVDLPPTQPPCKLPVVAFIVTIVFAAVELAALLLYDSELAPQYPSFGTYIEALITGGPLAASSMATGWLAFGSRPSSVNSSQNNRRIHFFRMGICATILTFITITIFSDHEWAENTMAVIIAAAIVWVCMVLYRDYLGHQLKHVSTLQVAEKSSPDYTIRSLLITTTIVAVTLGAFRKLIGHYQIEHFVIASISLAIVVNWLATVSWILGRWTNILFPLGCITLEATGLWTYAATKTYMAMELSSLVAAALLGMQIHLIAFLGILRASGFRFSRTVSN